jgi:hypothetical protein
VPTFLIVVDSALVVLILAAAAWAFVLAPLIVPNRRPRRAKPSL